MARRRKSPIRFVCKSYFTPAERKEWKLEPDEGYECVGHFTQPIRAAQFRNARGNEYVILHPSTKYRGEWQLSWFDERGPWSDTQVSSPDAGVKELLERWPLVRVDKRGRVQPNFTLEEWD